MKRNSDSRQEIDLSETPACLPNRGDSSLVLSYDRASTSPMQWSAFEHIVVLGDSYSSDAEKKWLGLLRKRLPSDSLPTIHNFAKDGDTVEDDLAWQLKRLFTRFPTAGSFEGGGEVLLIIWLGINDCGGTASDGLEPIVEQLFDAMHDLYTKWKARSFLLIDVPPMHRCPLSNDIVIFKDPATATDHTFLGKGKYMGIDDERYTTWNAELLRQAKDFATDASKASIFVVSSYAIISDILDDPEAYGLSDCIEAEDSNENGDEESGGDSNLDDDDDSQKAMWVDDIHLSTAGHQALANKLWTIFKG